MDMDRWNKENSPQAFTELCSPCAALLKTDLPCDNILFRFISHILCCDTGCDDTLIYSVQSHYAPKICAATR